MPGGGAVTLTQVKGGPKVGIILHERRFEDARTSLLSQWLWICCQGIHCGRLRDDHLVQRALLHNLRRRRMPELRSEYLFTITVAVSALHDVGTVPLGRR